MKKEQKPAPVAPLSIRTRDAGATRVIRDGKPVVETAKEDTQ